MRSSPTTIAASITGWTKACRFSPRRWPVDQLDRLACGHEHPVPLHPTEAHICATLGQQDAPDQLAVWREHRNAILALATGEPAPHVALDIYPDAVGPSFGVEEHASVHRPIAI